VGRGGVFGGLRGGEEKSERGVLMGVDGDENSVLRGVSNLSLLSSLENFSGAAFSFSGPCEFFSEVNEKISIVKSAIDEMKVYLVACVGAKDLHAMRRV